MCFKRFTQQPPESLPQLIMNLPRIAKYTGWHMIAAIATLGVGGLLQPLVQHLDEHLQLSAALGARDGRDADLYFARTGLCTDAT